MTTSKIDLYRQEWLELVFAKRNKEYGAYYLRQHNAGNTSKAMIITFVTVTALFIIGGQLVKAKPVDVIHEVRIDLSKVYTAKTDPPKKEIQKAKAAPPKQQVKTTVFLPPVVTPTPPPIEPPSLETLNVTAVGSVKSDGDSKEGTSSVANGPGTDGSDPGPTKNDNTPYDNGTIEINPEPNGGAAAWAKFLQKNLRYPGEAVDKGISGKVFVTFIVEKDGHLSSFEILRGMGYGMDEESLRVLKKAPAWKPGIQNGRPVRVKFTLPLNFVLGTDN